MHLILIDFETHSLGVVRTLLDFLLCNHVMRHGLVGLGAGSVHYTGRLSPHFRVWLLVELAHIGLGEVVIRDIVGGH